VTRLAEIAESLNSTTNLTGSESVTELAAVRALIAERVVTAHEHGDAALDRPRRRRMNE
jgi:hypothetical protein